MRSAEAMQQLWLEQGDRLEELPKVDFTTSMVIGLFADAGTYTTIPAIKAIQQQNDVLTVVCGTRQVPWPAVNPVSVIAIPRFDGRVVFTDDDTQVQAERRALSGMPEGQVVEAPSQVGRITFRRPFGLTLLTVLNCIFSGVLPVLTVSILIVRADADIATVGVGLVQAVLACAILWFSFTAWRGDDPARQRLLITLAIFYGLQIASAALILAFVGVSETGLARVLGLTARSLAWLAINRWYFRRPATLAWYVSRSISR